MTALDAPEGVLAPFIPLMPLIPLIVGAAAVALAPELLLASATKAIIRAMTATKLERPSATASHYRHARSLL